MPLSPGMNASDTVPAGTVQPSLASFGDVAVGACYYSLGFWKGDSISMDSRIPDHRLLTNFRKALLPSTPGSQTFLHKPKMWLWSPYQLLLPSLSPRVSFSSEGLRHEELTVGPGCIAWMRAWPGSS